MKQYKILFVGPVASGKTTAVKSLCGEDNVVTTCKKTSDEVASIKGDTTVSLDYGILPFNSGLKLHIYAAPGQERFHFMHDILMQGTIGTILLLSMRHIKVEEVGQILYEYLQVIESTPCIVGVTQTEGFDQGEIDLFLNAIFQYHPSLSDTMTADVRKKHDVLKLVEKMVVKANER
ncbi:hypothetical protein PE074_03610 [Wohlfahrtiimonas chitiniclastica]|uniref:Uncharacterized protein n=2 Tax=Wohlfahrtiimonas chitiniclastica TaxID=400946 RepID=L8XUT3_9GAMM|nr:hypothetical protein [Wohlfahrtiimonas chitiniclastica]ELV07672.1 Hypothetical protein F387_01476 [Wohlfahrtiimonas chitiniclastica SH04]KZS23661.1 hypothetical protein BMY_1528 [Wohlfahrtiimonas chitiniclastica]KZX36443.1 hypothetical protein A6V30_08610 [Wohlfahrtiimonas chitiniclastica]MBS7814928.1 hypothetical protein [Wohlfahrtiimonas chitiniclastica]MBS7817071.1 hypothetical protein [Wohlfahrtiimonas chitiniclastica]